jgi:hypothetical protein
MSTWMWSWNGTKQIICKSAISIQPSLSFTCNFNLYFKTHSCVRELKRENKELKESIEQLKADYKKLTESLKNIDQNQPTNGPSVNDLYKCIIIMLIIGIVFFQLRKYIANFDLYFSIILIFTAYLFVCYKTKTNVLFLVKFLLNKNQN